MAGVTRCGFGGSIAATTVDLPETVEGELERYEGMFVNIPETLTVSEVFNLGRFGEVSLSGAGRLYNSTAVADRIRSVDGVEGAVVNRLGFVEVEARSVRQLMSVGTVAADRDLRWQEVTDGAAPQRPREALIAASSAKRYEVALGDTVRVLGQRGPVEVVVTGFTTSPGGTLGSTVYVSEQVGSRLGDVLTADDVSVRVAETAAAAPAVPNLAGTGWDLGLHLARYQAWLAGPATAHVRRDPVCAGGVATRCDRLRAAHPPSHFPAGMGTAGVHRFAQHHGELCAGVLGGTVHLIRTGRASQRNGAALRAPTRPPVSGG